MNVEEVRCVLAVHGGSGIFSVFPQKCHNDLLDTRFLAAQDCSWGGGAGNSVGLFPQNYCYVGLGQHHVSEH